MTRIHIQMETTESRSFPRREQQGTGHLEEENGTRRRETGSFTVIFYWLHGVAISLPQKVLCGGNWCLLRSPLLP